MSSETKALAAAAAAIALGLAGALAYRYIDSAAYAYWAFTAYFGYGSLLAVVMYALAMRGIADVRARGLIGPAPLPAVTVAIPAFNERDCVNHCVESLLAQTRPVARIIVVNDGSGDDTLERLRERFALEPAALGAAGPQPDPVRAIYRSRTAENLWVIDKANGGKAAALNAALARADTPLFVSGDADTVFTPAAIAAMAEGFAAFPSLKAAGGVVVAANGLERARLLRGESRAPRRLLVRLQWLEYATGAIWRFAWAHLNCLMLLSGSFSGFDTRVLRASGGFDTDSVTEDYEIAYRLHAHCRRHRIAYRMLTLPDALAYTLVPETLASLTEQRTRWFQGFLGTLIKHRASTFGSGFGWFGFVALPIKWLDAVMPMWGLFTYGALAYQLASSSLPVSGVFLGAVIGTRASIELGFAGALLRAHQRHVGPRLGRPERVKLFLLLPLNLWFQRVLWFVYALRAYARVWGNVRRWEKTRHYGFAGQASG